MPTEPVCKRTVAFFDGQNLFYAAKHAFGYGYPNYDPLALAGAVCRDQGWDLTGVRFYTGLPSATDSPHWNHFWTAKLAVMGTRGIHVFTRPLKYRNRTVPLPGGGQTSILIGQEKGIDVRIALDIVRMARKNEYDVALLFSQDQDLSEAADEVRCISAEEDRWIKIASAYPMSPVYQNSRGVNKTDWIPLNRDLYNACVDPVEYRPKP